MPRRWVYRPTIDQWGALGVAVPDLALRHLEVGVWGVAGAPVRRDASVSASVQVGWSLGMPCDDPGTRFALMTMHCLPQSADGWGRGTVVGAIRTTGPDFTDDADVQAFVAAVVEQLRGPCWTALRHALMSQASLLGMSLGFPDMSRRLLIDVIYRDDEAFHGQVPPEEWPLPHLRDVAAQGNSGAKGVAFDSQDARDED